MSAEGQLRLCSVHVDERALDDVSRTVMEAIDRLGSITARQAGAIVYRFRGYDLLVAVPRPWLVDAGRRALRHLENAGLIRRASGSWARAENGGRR